MQDNIIKPAIAAMHGPHIWSDAAIRHARFGPLRQMYYSEGDSYDSSANQYGSVVLMEDTRTK